MSETHIIDADDTNPQPNKWRWSCSCGEKAKDGYPSKRNALNGGAVHQALRTVMR